MLTPPPRPNPAPTLPHLQALEFAQRVPKPKVRKRQQPKDAASGERTNVGMVLGPEHLTKVEKLEMQHDKMRSDVDAIRREFGL